MGKKLYVGNLAYSVTSESLEQMFLEFGTVTSAQVIQDRETGRSKGFGFVEMQTDDAAQRAISGMHEKMRPSPVRAVVVVVAAEVVTAVADAATKPAHPEAEHVARAGARR